MTHDARHTANDGIQTTHLNVLKGHGDDSEKRGSPTYSATLVSGYD